MNNEAGFDTLIARLTAIFGKPRSSDPAGFARELRMLLDRFTDEQLYEAGSILIANADKSYWPMPKTILMACVEAAAKLAYPTTGAEIKTKSGKSVMTNEQADNLIRRSDIGQTAVDQGWIASLHDFCVQTGELPNPREQAEMWKNARELEQMYEDITGGSDEFSVAIRTAAKNSRDEWASKSIAAAGGLRKAQIRLVQTCFTRRRLLAERIFGSEVADGAQG